MPNKTVIIVPTYNERDNIEPLLEQIFAAVPEVNVLFVDDNSPDKTGELVDEIITRDPRVNILHRETKEGLGRAYIAGFKWALERNYEKIMEMDADLSHNPADLPGMIAAADEADLVLGSRYIGGIRIINWPLSRLILSKGAALYVRILTRMPFSDPTGGFKCFRRGLMESLDLDNVKSNGYSFQIELSYKAWITGFQIVEHPITFIERRSGESKMDSKIIREAILVVWSILAKAKFKRSPGKQVNPKSVTFQGVG